MTIRYKQTEPCPNLVHNHDDLGDSTGVVHQNPARRHKGPYVRLT